MKRVGLGLWRGCENLYIQVSSIFHNFPLNDSIVIPCCYSRSLTVHIKSSPVRFDRFGATEAVDLAIFNGWCCESLWLNRKSGPGSFWVGNRRQHGWKSPRNGILKKSCVGSDYWEIYIRIFHLNWRNWQRSLPLALNERVPSSKFALQVALEWSLIVSHLQLRMYNL